MRLAGADLRPAVRLVEPLGRDTLLYFDPGSERAFVAVSKGLNVADLKVGAPMALSLHPQRLYLFGADGKRIERGPRQLLSIRAPRSWEALLTRMISARKEQASRSVRLVGFDAAESGLRAKCESERALAAKATFRLRQLVSAGGLDLELVACAWRPGTEGTPLCNYGRACGVLTAAGKTLDKF